MKKYFSYVRVSTPRQEEQGVSLQQQTDAIERYASRQALKIAERFEEIQTAAKRGRPVFSKMLRSLKAGGASGVIIHKIDRSARNLKDWADLGELIDQGVEVHFANESLDLQSRGGRLSADIQAVVAADYIRNLREETIKGFYGRLKQGLYPRPAPVGYLNVGKGQPKTIDPVKGPLVKQAFELYASGKVNLEILADEMYRRGLTSKQGRWMDRNRLSEMLNNHFYMGLIVIRKTDQQFAGIHAPLVSAGLFATVQQVLKGRFGRRVQKNSFLYRRLLKCKSCGKSLIGEIRKGKYLYYRCHTTTCPTTNIAEPLVDDYVFKLLRPLQISVGDKQEISNRLSVIASEWEGEKRTISQALQIRSDNIAARQQKLTDAYLDDLIDKPSFEQRKAALVIERQNVSDEINRVVHGTGELYLKHLSEFIELAESAYLLFKNGNQEEKRQLLKLVTSERLVDAKTPMFTLHPAFQEIANRQNKSDGGASCAIHRDVRKVIDRITPIIFKEMQELESMVDKDGVPLLDKFHALVSAVRALSQ